CPARARAGMLEVARRIISQAGMFPAFSKESAAWVINDEIGRINYALAKLRLKPREKPTVTQLTEYTPAYVAAVMKDGPMRLLAVPVLNKKARTLQTPAKSDLLPVYSVPDEELIYHYPPAGGTLPLPVQGYRFKPHGFVTPDEIDEAIQEGKSL